ncbi:MAG: FtsK/SpoIIIE domain-containing protein [Phycisphaerales bacterium]
MTRASHDHADPQRDELAWSRAEPWMVRTRQVVADMRRLCAARAEAERQMTAERDAALKAATRERDEATREADERLAAKMRQLEQEVAKRTEQIETRYAEAIGPAKERYEQASNDVKRRRADVLEKIEASFKEAKWLAETVVEGASPRLRAQLRELHASIKGSLSDVAKLEDEARALAAPAQPAPEPVPEDPKLAELDGPGAKAALDEQIAETRAALEAARTLTLPKLSRGGVLAAAPPILALGAAAGVGFAVGWSSVVWPVVVGVVVGGALGGLAFHAWRVARVQITRASAGVLTHAARARAVAATAMERFTLASETELANLTSHRNKELESAQSEHAATRSRATAKFDAEAASLRETFDRETREITEKRDASTAEMNEKAAQHQAAAEGEHESATRGARETFEAIERETLEAYDKAHAAMKDAWISGMTRVSATGEEVESEVAAAFPSWSSPSWRGWVPPVSPAPGATVGRLKVSGAAMPGGLPEDPDLLADFSTSFDLPAAIDLPGRASLLIEAGDAARPRALAAVRVAMARLLAGYPPGRVRFTILDPVGLGQSFAGFMRLTDHDPALVNARIWTEQRHIEQRLTDLTEHMETVIQKYLRDEYATIEAYNEVAGEIAEPYRYLVVADFPANFTDEAGRRLASIADSGARCGVHTIILADPSKPTPQGVDLDDMRAHALVIQAGDDGSFSIADDVLGAAPLTLDDEPEERVFDELIRKVGAASVEAGRVEVPFRTIAPEDDQLWTRSSANEVLVPLGKSGATRVHELSLGKGTSQHALIAGKTGSGKSTLLHVMITAAAMWHSPDELEFYLVDFKKGVEFKAYAGGEIPHIRAVAIESDREFGLSVLQRLDDELKARGDLFREVGAQSIGAFREARPGHRMPRILLVIDEFQEFFVEDDRIAQDAALLLDRLVRQGRAFGIHVLLGSQTLSGAYTLARSTVGQMGVRIALQCSETDSYLILSEDNGAARLLTRPGEAIYNDAGGLVEGNTPFQTSWLGDKDRDSGLARVANLARERGVTFEAPIVFEGNAAARLETNAPLEKAASGEAPTAPLPAPRAWVGDPVAIKDAAGATLRRRSGSNLLIMGQQSETALGMISGALLSLAAQHGVSGPGSARFVILDGTPEDDPGFGVLKRFADALPHEHTFAGWRETADALAVVDALVTEREESNKTGEPAVFVLINGLHRLRALRRKEDDFSFSMDDEDKPASPDKMLAHVLREGPGLGVFAICWCDTAASLSRSLERSSVGEFEQRALMQMSSADSSQLIESAGASRLGLNRAIFHSDETGVEEKFRPYGVPDEAFVCGLADRLRARG